MYIGEYAVHSHYKMNAKRIYTVSQKNCTILFLQYQIKLYFCNFWRTCTPANLEQNDITIVDVF